MATPPPHLHRGPMTNEALAGHGIAAICGLLAAATLVPSDTGSGWLPALLGTLAALGVVGLNAAAIGLRVHTRLNRWALANAGLVAVTFVGALLTIEAGRELWVDPTPTLWVQLFIALVGGSVLVAQDQRRS